MPGIGIESLKVTFRLLLISFLLELDGKTLSWFSETLYRSSEFISYGLVTHLRKLLKIKDVLKHYLEIIFWRLYLIHHTLFFLYNTICYCGRKKKRKKWLILYSPRGLNLFNVYIYYELYGFKLEGY